MLMQSSFYDDLIRNTCFDRRIYEALNNKDIPEAVIAGLHLLKRSSCLATPKIRTKTDEHSEKCRNLGNQLYAKGEYHKALEQYNMAILLAPANTKALQLAYGNRSALFCHLKAYEECVADVESSFEIACPAELADKLNSRKAEALHQIFMLNLRHDSNTTSFPEEFFNIENKNPQMPWLIEDVGIIREANVPKIVALDDIKVGTVLGVETAFVSQVNTLNLFNSCYFCQKMQLNLQPCDSCNMALFCDDKCKTTCWEEYHMYECRIRYTLDALGLDETLSLALKAVIKMRTKSCSWDEIIEASKYIGIQRMKTSPLQEIFNRDYKFSLLSMNDDKHFIHGKMFNKTLAIGMVIYYLGLVPEFLPDNATERMVVVRAIGKIMMSISMFYNLSQVDPAVYLAVSEKKQFHDRPNYGYYSFMGKVSHSCNPNTMAVCIGNKMALIAIRPIAPGTEITYAFLGHRLDYSYSTINYNKLFRVYGNICNCIICNGHWEQRKSTYSLTDLQKRNYRKITAEDVKQINNLKDLPQVFPKICKILSVLSDAPYTHEYRHVYGLFRKCILLILDSVSRNYILK